MEESNIPFSKGGIQLEEKLRDMINQLNERLKTDEKLKETLKEKKRFVEIEITDNNTYNFLLENAEVKDFSTGSIEKPDIKITTDTATLTGILNEEINPLKAYVTKKLKVKASLMDLLTIKNLLSN